MPDSENSDVDQDAQAPPREGTLDWLALQPTVLVDGLELPAVHRVPAGATLAPDDGRNCRVVRPDGVRCGAPRTRSYGVCLVHAGGGSRDHAALSRQGHAAKAKMRQRRTLLGIGAHRSGDPRQIARVAALARAESLADALLAPLDDDELGSLARQRAAVVALDATFPLATASIEVSLPVDEASVSTLSWQEMQVLAARLLDQDETYQDVPALLPAQD